MLYDPRTPIVIGTLLILSLVGALAVYSPLPGGLSSPHQAIARLGTLSGCEECHRPGGFADGCLGCHTEIERQLSSGRGYHHWLRGGGELRCAECHSEHAGSGFDLVNPVSWGAQTPRGFKHPHVEFGLAGRHALLECEACHRIKLSRPFALDGFPELTRAETFLGLVQECASCHDDVHAGGLTGSCDSCHGQDAFRPTPHFDHSRRFPLEGGHERVACGRCHVIPLPGSPPRPDPWPFDQVRGLWCASCHDSPHRALFGADCSACHPPDEDRWSAAIASMTAETHALTGFLLDAPHDAVACERCHARDRPFIDRYPDATAPGYLRRRETCEGCHEDVHYGQFGAAEARCTDCHQSHRFVPAAFGPEDHARSWPLHGAHEGVACASCHIEDPGTRVTRFARTSKSCRTCHEDPHGSQFAREAAAGDCDSCHAAGSDSFRIRPFDHARLTGYPLEGGHAKARCEGCHIEVLHIEVLEESGEAMARVRRYRGTPVRCSSCHADVHRGQLDHHGEEGCRKCHPTSAGWEHVRFDHDADSRFPLRGAHAKAACERCHPPVELAGGAVVVQYRPLGKECTDCHDFTP